MAPKLASNYSYSHYRDADASSEYQFDLTAEEEDLLEILVANASARPPDAIPNPTASSALPQSSGAVSTLGSGVAAALAAHTSVPPISHSETEFSIREIHQGLGSANRDESLLLSGLAASGAEPLPDVDAEGSDDEIAAVIEEAEHRMPQPVQVGHFRYPDLSRALSDTFERPDNQAECTTSGDRAREKLSPLLRFRSYPKKPFSVSDLVAGAWCELQYYYTLTRLPGGKKTRTAAMKGGTKVHQTLEDEIYTTVTIEITKKEDAFGLKLWNLIQGLRTMRDTGMTRELEVWGLVDGHVVNGVIDHLSYDNPDPDSGDGVTSSPAGGEPSKGDPQEQKITTFFPSSAQPKNRKIFITDVKTRASRHIPSGAALRPTKIQLFLYHRFLSEMAAGRLDFLQVIRRYGLEPDESFSDTFVAQIGSLHDEIFEDAADDSAASPDLIRYRTLRQLTSLLEGELRLTFPDGADSLGSLVAVEYRRRARRSAVGAEEDPDDGEAGTLLGSHVLRIDAAALDSYLRGALEWWDGKRPPDGVVVEEAYKCRSCEFADDCEWRRELDAGMLRAARQRAAERRVRGENLR